MASECIVALAVLVTANRATLSTDKRQPCGVKMCEEFCTSLVSCVRPTYVERYLLCDLTRVTSKQVSVSTRRGNLPHPKSMRRDGKLGALALNLSQRVIISRRNLQVLVTLGLKKQTHPTDPEPTGAGKGKEKTEPNEFISMTTSTFHYDTMHLLMRRKGTHFYFIKVLNLTSCKLLEPRRTLPDKNLATPSRLYTGTCVRNKRKNCVHVLYVGSHVYITTLVEDWSRPVLRFENSLEVFRFPERPVSCFSSKDDSVSCFTNSWIYRLKIFESLALAENSSIQLRFPQVTHDVTIDLDSGVIFS